MGGDRGSSGCKQYVCVRVGWGDRGSGGGSGWEVEEWGRSLCWGYGVQECPEECVRIWVGDKGS